MGTKASAVEELVREAEGLPPEVLEAVVGLARALRRRLAAEIPEAAEAQAERVLAGYREKAAGYDFGLPPDADYAQELMAVYLSTFPHTPVEADP